MKTGKQQVRQNSTGKDIRSENMKIIDVHLHFVPENPYFQEIAVRAEHKNTEEDLRAVYQKYGIVGGVVMGNRGVDPAAHSYPDFLKYCVGLDRDFLVSQDKKRSLDQMEANLKREDCVGIKLYPHVDRNRLIISLCKLIDRLIHFIRHIRFIVAGIQLDPDAVLPL